MEHWDPLELQDTATTEIVAAARKREIRNILKSYVGFFDPFCELIQNALDAIDLREQTLKEKDYKKRIWIDINLEDNTLTVTDNGIGFSESQFKTFLSPSISFKNTKSTRGNKGVGATYLAYGFNDLTIGTKTPSYENYSQIQNGREWIDDEDTIVARPIVKTKTSIAERLKKIDRGSSFSLKFYGNVRPKSLTWIAAENAEQWRVLLLIKTPLGQILGSTDTTSTTFDLTVTDSQENTTSLENQPCTCEPTAHG
jgi:hypothetical protein